MVSSRRMAKMRSMEPIVRAQGRVPRVEARWPAALAVLVLLGLLVAVPRAVRVLPEWVLYVTAAIVFAPMLLAGLSGNWVRWRRAEQVGMGVFFVVAAPAMLAQLATLIVGMLRGNSGLGGLELFVSSSMLWLSNVLIFSLVYWHVDRGGPHARAGDQPPRPDWLFPQYDLAPEYVPPHWRPTFVDYLYLSVSTATAFSTTDVAPLTARAKQLMMLELAIALVTIVVVGARAINVLGS
jgi:uncharacterized membrane protein